MSAICITLGEQSENHIGMKKQGNGLAVSGFKIKDLGNIKSKYEKLGGQYEWVELVNGLKEEDKEECMERAVVLVLRNAVDIISNSEIKNEIMEELLNCEWDKKYWDVRRKKWLNKNARYNLCFGDQNKALNEEEKSGTIIAYDNCPKFKLFKNKMEEFCNQGKLEAEGNYYYNLKKTGIGFHGDAERKKVIGCNFATSDREIHWQWYLKGDRIGDRMKVQLNHGDCYIMSERATGYNWKKRNILTLRHAAGIAGSKYLK